MPAVRYLDIPVRHPGTDTLLRELVGQSGTVVLPGTSMPANIAEDKDGTFPIPGAVLTVSDDLRLPVFWDIDGNLELEFVSGEYRLPLVSPTGLQTSAQEAASSAVSAAYNADLSRQAAENAAAGAEAPTDDAVAGFLNEAGSLTRAAVDPAVAVAVADKDSDTRAAIGDEIEPSPGDHVQYVTTNGDDANSGLSWGSAKATIQAAINALDGQPGIVHMAPGSYSEPTITPTNNLTIEGAGYGFYSVGANGPTLLTASGDTPIFDVNGRGRLTFRDLTLKGNGGSAGIAANQSKVNNVQLERVKFYDFGYGFVGKEPDPSSNVTIRDCVFRQCMVGVNHLRDSAIVQTVFSGNTNRAIHLNSGQVRILGNFIEWQRGGPDNSRADGIYLGPNANEILISDNMFDRNTGYDVYIDSRGSSNIPDRLVLSGNMFKGPAWASNISKDSRFAVAFSGSVNRLVVVGNLVQRRNSSPSTLKGVESPHGFIGRVGSSGAVSNLTLASNDTTGLADTLNTGTGWVQSGSGTNEWYFRHQGGDVSPDIPDMVRVDGIALTKGTVGSLTSGEWGYGDNDNLGLSTVYVRLAAGPPADRETLLDYDVPLIPGWMRTAAQSETSLGGWGTGDIPAGTSRALSQLPTSQHVGTNSVTPVLIDVWIRNTNTNFGWVTLPVLLRRAGGVSVTAELGTPTVHHGGVTIGGPGSGRIIEVAFAVTDFGKFIAPTVTNNAGSPQRASLSIRRMG